MNTAPPSPPRAAPDGQRILIVEEALHSLKGHWFEHIKTITDACRRSGDTVLVVAHRDAHERILRELHARTLLPSSAWDRTSGNGNPLKRYFGVFQHNWRLYRTVDSLLRGEEKWDCVLAPTILIHHLIAWTLLAHKYRGKKFSRLALIFINGQGIYQGAGRPPRFSRHPKNALFRFLLRRLRRLVESGEVVLGSEAQGMAKEFSDFCGVPFQHFPHPVEFDGFSKHQQDPPSKHLTFSCFGFARHEKGSDLLQEAILAIRRRRPDLRIRFLIQWLDDFALPDGTIVTQHPRLLADPDVTFVAQPFDAATYRRLLAETDAMILPYRASSYYARVSRVAIEAAVTGIPIVYTRHTWLQELVDQCGAGIGFENENLEDLTSAIIRMAEQITPLKEQARQRSSLARELHAARNYRAALLSPRQICQGSPEPSQPPAPAEEQA